MRQRIAEVVLEVENEPLEETARRIVERRSAEGLAQLVADWLAVPKRFGLRDLIETAL